MIEERIPIPCDPIAVARKLLHLPGLALLHSSKQAYGLGRYSILAANPTKRFSYRNGIAKIEARGASRCVEGDLFKLLELELGETISHSGELPFYGGAMGYFSYEAGRELERGRFASKESDIAGAEFCWYEGGLVFDHEEQSVFFVSSSEGLDTDLSQIREFAMGDSQVAVDAFELDGPLRSNFSRSEFCEAVNRVRDYILNGDVYQVNLSQRFEGKCSGSAFSLFERLASTSPAPYAAYLDFGDEQVVSSSPERFLHVSKAGFAQTRPIKGTRPAGETLEETERNELELEASEKDRSELLMIVDLERNDLGRVCEPGSVDVHRLFGLERYATVIHQTADVVGQLDSGRTALDCVKAMFPGGSITGAPKIRAMEIIEELERGARGVYTGSIGYFESGGAVDFNIAIRTIRIANGELSFQVGGGIVWDSDPESEYEETLVKAKAMMKAIGVNDGE